MDGSIKITIILILICLFTGITFLRIYLRTRLNGYLLISLGASLGLIGGIIDVTIQNASIIDIFAQTLIIIGIILFVIGLILISTIESGAVQNALSGHSIFEIMLGNVSSLGEKKYAPTLSRKGGIIVSSILIIYGIIKCWYEYTCISYSGIFIILCGLVIFVISIVALKKKSEKNKSDT